MATAATAIICTGLTPGFTVNWGVSTNATSYRLDISTDIAFGSFVPGYNSRNVGNVNTFITSSVGALAVGTPYFYRVRANNIPCGTNITNSNIITITIPSPSAVPVANAGSGATCNQITAIWQASANATTYLLDVSTSNTFASFVPGYNGLNTGNVTTLNVTGLTPGTTYYYRVRGSNSCGTSGNSGTITYATTAGLPAPAATAGTAAACTGFTANWSSVAGATNYYLDVSTDNAFGSFVGIYNNLDAATATTLNVTGLTAGTTYYYRLRAGNACGTSVSSNVITSATLDVAVAPVATAGSNAACTGITANWGAVAGATGYFLDVSTDNAFGSFVTGYNNLNVGNVLTSNVTGLTAGTTYYYRVRATNACGTGISSNVITYATLDVPAPVAIARNKCSLYPDHCQLERGSRCNSIFFRCVNR